MRTFSLYQGSNCERSYKYTKYIHVTDPFYLGRPRISRGGKLLYRGWMNAAPQRLTKRLDDREGPNRFLELIITNPKLLRDITNHKGRCIVDRYISDWNTGKYFLESYSCTIYKIDNDVVVFDATFFSITDTTTLLRASALKKLII